MKRMISRVLAGVCTISLLVTLIPTLPKVQAASWEDESINIMIDKGGYKTEIFGTGTYDYESGIDRTTKLPTATVYLTDNYKENVATVPTSDWGSSIVFDQYSESLYVHPLAFRAASNGMQMATPAVVDTTSYNDSEPEVASLLQDSSVELVVGGSGFTVADARVDATTDWTYDVVMANSAGSASMKITLAKGSPYAYYKFDSVTPQISLGAGANNLTIYQNSASSHQIGISVKNLTDGATHYYGLYAPEGTTWTNAGGKLTVNLPSGKDYLSIAALPDNTQATFDKYAQYAYNFVTDTIVTWEYNEPNAILSTTYQFVTTNQATGATGGDTIMALYPHQWRYAEESTSFAEYSYNTIRGTMKTIIGTEYVTQMTYGGILPALPFPTGERGEEVKTQLYYYWNYWQNENQNDPRWMVAGDYQYGQYDTYWMGKNLNRVADAAYMAYLLGDETYTTTTGDEIPFSAMKEDMLTALKTQLEYWFDPYQGYNQGDNYFYYHDEYGTLIGYPASYGSDFEVNDHHFHYGYWIKAAAAIALLEDESLNVDEEGNPVGKWEDSHGGMVYEMISDIANSNRNGDSYNKTIGRSETVYPFLRNFDVYEGHSWASGVANYEFDADGNPIDPNGGLAGGDNQESSTEAINAWASLILWGEAVGNKEIRDLGIYLYTTEIAAIEDYYFDVHGEIFTDSYVDADNYNVQSVTRLWGGRYDHTAWWTEDPIEVTTISMLPMTGATLYLGRYPEKVKAVYDSISPESVQWKQYIANYDSICSKFKPSMLKNEDHHQDILAEYYALYDAEAAIANYDSSDEGYVEFGESRAHTLEYIYSLAEYGTPNYEITSNDAFAMVFEKDGEKTYFVYNATGEADTVYFSDGTYVEIPEGEIQYLGDKTGDGVNPDADDPSKIKYNTEYYVETANGTYELNSTKTAKAEPDTTVTAVEVEIPGYTLDTANAQNVTSGTVTAENTVTLKLYYKRNTYTLSFELNGGTVSTTLPSSFKYGDNVALPVPTKTGMAFDGWYKDAALTQKVETTAGETGNLTLYAKYFDPNVITGITVSTSDITLLAGCEYRLTAAVIPDTVPDKTVTWSTSDSSVATVNNGMITAVKEGTATITATAADASYTAACVVTVKEIKETELGAYGARRDAAGNVIIYVSEGSADGVTLAFYKVFDSEAEAKAAVLNSLAGYNLTKNSEGMMELNLGKQDDSKYLAYAIQKVQETPVAIKISDIPGEAEPITTCTVSFNADGGSSVASQTVITGQKAYEPEEPTKSGMYFKGWQLDGTDYDFGSAVTGDITLTAVWSTEAEPVSYTVSFDTAGGSSVASQTVEAGKTASEPGIPTRGGYTFGGWTLNGSAYNFTTPVIGDITLVATWTENSTTEPEQPVYYTVSFDTAGGSSVASQTVEAGKTASQPATPTKEGYTFSGWTLNGSAYSFTTPVTGNINLVAVWTQDSTTEPEQPVYYTVSFDTAGGSSVASQTVKSGSAANVPATPTRDGYIFYGWTLNGVMYNFGNAVTANITLEAMWTIDSSSDTPSTDVKVSSILIRGGNQTIAVAGTVALSADVYPSNAANKKVTWTTKDTSIVVVNKDTGLVTGLKEGTATIYAIALDGSGVSSTCTITVAAGGTTDTDNNNSGNTDNSGNTNNTVDCTVVFDSTGGSTVAAQVVTKGGKASAPVAPVREGYTFAGWYNGEALYDFNTAVTGNITLTAKWTVNKVSSIKITGISKKIAVNKRITLTAIVNADALNKTVTWSVDKPNYASVTQSGVVKMKKAGKNKTVKVTATANDGSGTSATYSIKIMQCAVKKITLTGKKSVKAGSKVKLKATVNPVVSKKKINKTLQWTSNHPEWATVTKKGVVKTKKAGKGKTVKITAKATDGSNKKKSITIKIK